MSACLHVCFPACLLVSLPEDLPAYLHVCLPGVSMPACLLVCVCLCLNVCTPACLPSSVSVCLCVCVCARAPVCPSCPHLALIKTREFCHPGFGPFQGRVQRFSELIYRVLVAHISSPGYGAYFSSRFEYLHQQIRQ